MKRWAWILSLMPLWAACLVAPAQAGPISSLVVFGDSLSDNGQSLMLLGGSPRNADKQVAVEFIATALGVPLYDYAVSGARSDRDNSDANLNPALVDTGVTSQVGAYVWAPSGVNVDALHIISAGSNDVLDSLPTLDLSDPGAIDHLVKTIADNLYDAVTLMRKGGASRFLVALLPDMGRTPLATSMGMSDDLTLLSAAVNQGISATFSGTDVILFDTLAAQQSELTAFAAAGGNVDGTCLAARADAGDDTLSCDNYFFYDELHPTSAAHLALANDVLAAIPEPSALALAALALLAANAARRRRA